MGGDGRGPDCVSDASDVDDLDCLRGGSGPATLPVDGTDDRSSDDSALALGTPWAPFFGSTVRSIRQSLAVATMQSLYLTVALQHALNRALQKLRCTACP